MKGMEILLLEKNQTKATQNRSSFISNGCSLATSKLMEVAGTPLEQFLKVPLVMLSGFSLVQHLLIVMGGHHISLFYDSFLHHQLCCVRGR